MNAIAVIKSGTIKNDNVNKNCPDWPQAFCQSLLPTSFKKKIRVLQAGGSKDHGL